MARDRFDDDRYDDRPPRRRDDDRYDDRDRYEDDRDDRDRYDDRDRLPPAEPSNGPAMTSLILGILSIVGGLTAIPGLICGFAGLSKAKKLGGAGKGMAVTGIILSTKGVLILAGTIWLAIWFFGTMEDSRSRMVVSNNHKQIGLAMHNYHDSHGNLPGAAAGTQRFGGMNQPVRESELATKLSWRVEMLPYLEQQYVYMQFNMNEPWDSFRNRPQASTVLKVYSDPDGKSDPDTRHRVFYGRGTAFDPESGPGKLWSITDGTSNTIMVAESGQKVTWTRFGEMKYDPANPPDPATFGRPNTSTFQVVMFDGSVKSVRKTVNRETFKAAITSNVGEVVGSDW